MTVEKYPEPTTGGYTSIDALVGQTIDIAEVFTTRDGTLAVVTTAGTVFLCDNEWASAGASFIQAKLNANSADFTRERVVQEQGLSGFRPVEA